MRWRQGAAIRRASSSATAPRNAISATQDAIKRGVCVNLGELRVSAVWASPWCRTLDTARLAFPGLPVLEQPAFGSFFGKPEREEDQLREATALLAAWRGPGVLVVVTHQVTITALSGVHPESCEGVALRWTDGRAGTLGRLPAPPH